MSRVWKDVKVSARVLLRSPGFAVAAVVCIALGIGASTTIFSVVNAVLLKPLPYHQPDQLVQVYTEFPTFPGGGLPKFPVSPPEFQELRREVKAWSELSAYTTGGANLTGTSEPLRINAAFVTGNLLHMLGVKPEKGRLLLPEDDGEGAPLTMVLSHGLWVRAFGADESVVGRTVYLDGGKATVVGVMPRGFDFPPGINEPAEAWVPVQLTQDLLKRRASHFLSLIGRLPAGGSIEAARAELARWITHSGTRASENFHVINPKAHPAVLFPYRDEVVGNVRRAMLMLLGAVGLFLLIACVNVANLLLARSDARQREIAVRKAVGAGTGQLARQFIVEGLLLSGIGALTGLALAALGLQTIIATNAGMIPRVAEASMDWRVLAFAVCVTVATGVVFGLAPLVQLHLRPVNEALRSAAGRSVGSRASNRFRAALVAAELSLALVLLIGAGLLVRAFWKLQAVDPGFRAENVLSLRVSLTSARYNDADQLRRFWSALSDRISNLPGATGATIAAGLPPLRNAVQNDTDIENFVPRPGGPAQNVAFYQTVGDRFFETLGIRLVDGRFFEAKDGFEAAPVVIINQTMARTFWPGESAIGRRIKPSQGPGRKEEWATIVGVVADVRNAGLDKPAGTEIFLPARQLNNASQSAYILVRAPGDPMRLASAVRQAIREVDPELPVAQVRTMADVVSASQSRPQFLAMMLTLFSVLALALAAFGIYGVISYSVAQRTNEFGIRMALGAQRRDVLSLVLRQGGLLALAGVAIGAGGSLLMSSSLEGMLFGVTRFDIATFTWMSGVLVCVALLASVAPARRATAVDPIQALRYE
jgi:predicted permease